MSAAVSHVLRQPDQLMNLLFDFVADLGLPGLYFLSFLFIYLFLFFFRYRSSSQILDAFSLLKSQSSKMFLYSSSRRSSIPLCNNSLSSCHELSFCSYDDF